MKPRDGRVLTALHSLCSQQKGKCVLTSKSEDSATHSCQPTQLQHACKIVCFSCKGLQRIDPPPLRVRLNNGANSYCILLSAASLQEKQREQCELCYLHRAHSSQRRQTGQSHSAHPVVSSISQRKSLSARVPRALLEHRLGVPLGLNSLSFCFRLLRCQVQTLHVCTSDFACPGSGLFLSRVGLLQQFLAPDPRKHSQARV